MSKMGTSAGKSSTPVEIVQKNNPLIKNIARISRKWNRRWAEIQNPWPTVGTFDPEVIRTIQVLVDTHKAGQKKGRKGRLRKEKREMELAMLELFSLEGQKLLKVANARREKITDGIGKRLEETGILMSKINTPFTHMTQTKNPPPYEKEGSADIYPQLPVLSTEGRYTIENDDEEIVETGKAETTVVLRPDSKRKQRLRGRRERDRDASDSQSEDEEEDEEEGPMGGYDPIIRRILAKAERKGAGSSQEKGRKQKLKKASACALSDDSLNTEDERLASSAGKMKDPVVRNEVEEQVHKDLEEIEERKENIRKERDGATDEGEIRAMNNELKKLEANEQKLEDTLRRYHLRQRKKTPRRKIMPVIVRGRNLEYKPWANTDMSDIREKLPILQDGAHPWIAKLEEALIGTQPAMGDMKRLLASLVGVPAMEELFDKAGLRRYVVTAVYDPELFAANRGRLWTALREMYPTNVHPDNILIEPLGDNENPRAYVARALQQWRDITGSDAETNRMEQSVVRGKIQQGLPPPVRAKLQEVVGLGSMTKGVYVDHVAHQVELHRKREYDIKQQDQETLRRLNQIQLTEGQKSKNKKQAVVVSQSQPPPSQPIPQPQSQPQQTLPPPAAVQPFGPQPAFGYPWPFGASQPWRGGGRGNFNGGRGSSNGNRGRGNFSPGTQQSLRCFVCGRPGHLARNCERATGGNFRGNFRGGLTGNFRGARQGQGQQFSRGPVNPYRGPDAGF